MLIFQGASKHLHIFKDVKLKALQGLLHVWSNILNSIQTKNNKKKTTTSFYFLGNRYKQHCYMIFHVISEKLILKEQTVQGLLQLLQVHCELLGSLFRKQNKELIILCQIAVKTAEALKYRNKREWI